MLINEITPFLGIIHKDSKAQPIDSPFGRSSGKSCQRFEFRVLSPQDDRDHIRSAWIACAEKVSWYNKRWYVPCQVAIEGEYGRKELRTIWLNKASLKKRISNIQIQRFDTAKKVEFLREILQEPQLTIPNKKQTRPADTELTKMSAERRLNSDTQKTPICGRDAQIQYGTKEPVPPRTIAENVLMSRKKLIDAIKTNSESTISEKEIEACLQYAGTHPQYNPTVVSTRTSRLSRTLLLGPQGRNYLLFTKTRSLKDKQLGKGAFKKAKYAIDLSTGKRYVVATSRIEGPLERDALKQEIESHEALKHIPEVVKLHDYFMEGDRAYFILDECNEGDLFSGLHGDRANNVLPKVKDDDVLTIARDCARGLLGMHSARHLYQDMKEENIFLYTDDKNKLRAKIGDLGLSCHQDDTMRRRWGAGTYHICSPEKAKAALSRDPALMLESATPADDVWAFGLVLFSLFTKGGLPECIPFGRGKDVILGGIAQLKQDQIDQVINRSITDPAVKHLLKRMLSVDRSKRAEMTYVSQALEEMGHATAGS